VVAATNPFFLPALLSRCGRQCGKTVIHLVFDLYPDALIWGGGWSEWHPLCRFAARMTRSAIRDSAATVYLGRRLREYAEKKYGVGPNTAVIPVGTDTMPFLNVPPVSREKKQIQMLYSGHFGRLHDWRTLAEALPAALRQNEGLAVEFAASGPGFAKLREPMTVEMRTGNWGDRIAFGSTLPAAKWRDVMLAADVALVTMIPGAERVVMPSKTYSAMAAGQAVLAICPRESDLADLIRQHDCGWVVEPGAVAGLVRTMQAIAGSPVELLRKRQNAWNAAHSHYSMEAVGRRWLTLFESLGIAT
jgi:glycosyltransferase involved in cell wall biosynthesis